MGPHLKKEERRAQLLKAALEAFGERGYHSTQVSDIIAKADVARGTFYLYFEGKREIFDAVITGIFEKVQREIRAIPKEAVEEIPAQILGNLQRVADLLVKNSLFIKLLFSDAVGLDADFDERLRVFYGKILDYIRRGLKQGQEMGFVREGDIPVLATCLLGCVKEVFYQSVLGTEKPSTNAIVREIYTLVVNGIVHPKFRELVPPPL
jgi:AcrR family transcriptional regulator